MKSVDLLLVMSTSGTNGQASLILAMHTRLRVARLTPLSRSFSSFSITRSLTAVFTVFEPILLSGHLTEFSALEPSRLRSRITVVRRNPAFRIASGGLAVAVMLCLVGAITLLRVTPSNPVESPVSPSEVLQVATAGDESHLLDEHPRNLVPEPVDLHSPNEYAVAPAESLPLHSPHPGPSTSHPEGDDSQSVQGLFPPTVDPVQNSPDSPSHAVLSSPSTTEVEAELTQLKCRVGELARSQLEAQLGEIRHAEQLLSTHQTNRLIEALQREVDELKEQRLSLAPAREQPPELTDTDLVRSASMPHDGMPPESVGDTLNPDQSLGSTLAVPEDVLHQADDVPRDPANLPLTRVRYSASPDAEGRYDVDADEASLTEFLTKLGPVAGWNLVSGPRMQGTVTCRWQGVELQPALIQLLKVHGWQVRQEGDFAVVEPLPRPLSENPANAPGSPAAGDDSASPITLELAPDVTGLFPPGGASGNSRSGPVPFPGHPAIRTPLEGGSESDRTESRSISLSSREPGALRTGRIVMTDYPELMAQGTPPVSPQLETPQCFEIEASILEIRPAMKGARGVFRQALSVGERGPCPLCGITHAGPIDELGHTVNGWLALGEGLSGGVCPLTLDGITTQLQLVSTISVTATPRVQVQNHQLAEIVLTEQQGFRRHIVRHSSGSAEVTAPTGAVQISLRPSGGEDGQIRLDLRPSSLASAEGNPRLVVPPNQCVVIGGMEFERVRSSETKTEDTAADLYEIVIVIRVRPSAGVEILAPETQAASVPSRP